MWASKPHLGTMTSAHTSPADEARLLHEGIQAVAAQCDGAISDDGVGFDGGDTAYGRRIAGVSFDKLSADDHYEIARIANKYQKQILARTGLDVTTFATVQAAKGGATNHTSRQNARRFEKLSAVQAARKVTLLPSGKVGLSWASKGDPDFSDLLAGVRALPGRSWNAAAKTNEVNATPELLTFATLHDMEVPAEVIAAVEGQQAAQAAAPTVYNVGVLKGSGGSRLWVKAEYNAERVAEARSLPGRRWNGGDKLDEVDAHPAVLAFAEKWGLAISPKAQAAINDAGEEVLDAAAPTLDRAGLMSLASRAGNINDLPADFVALVTEAVG